MGMKTKAIASHFQPEKTEFVYDNRHAGHVEHWNSRLQEDFVTKLEQQIVTLIRQIYSGDEYAVAEAITGMSIDQYVDFEPLARLIVMKAFSEPQNSEAYAILSRALHSHFPALPSRTPGKKAESFMHSILDVLQTEFEELLMDPMTTPTEQNTMRSQVRHMDPSSKMRAAVQFVGHLHRQGVLGSRVVSHMVHDLIGVGQVGCARDLLQMVGVVLDKHERGCLEPVLEVSNDGEPSSESEP